MKEKAGGEMRAGCKKKTENTFEIKE